MKIGKSSNPALSDSLFQNATLTKASDKPMTIAGAVNKTVLLLLIALVTATITWKMHYSGKEVMTWALVGGIGGLVVAIATVFKPQWSPYSAPLYAALEGLVLGSLSAIFSDLYDGIIMQAVGLTFSILLTLLLVYRTGVIKATPKFRRGVIAATGGVAVVYIMSWVLGMFGIDMPFLHEGGTIGIIISLVIIVIAALNLILDFDFIERGAEQGAPKYMEWYGAFGLMITLVWLYLEILRLLAMLSGRD